MACSGIEFWTPRPLTNTLPTRLMGQYIYLLYKFLKYVHFHFNFKIRKIKASVLILLITPYMLFVFPPPPPPSSYLLLLIPFAKIIITLFLDILMFLKNLLKID